MLQQGEHLHDLRVGRLDDEIDEADLTLGDVGRLAVVELAHWESMNFLEVALREELNEEQIAPEAAQSPRLRRVRDVGQMEHELDEEFFVFALHGVEVVVDEATAQRAQLNEVLRHVRRQHRLDYHMSHALELVTRHLRCPVTLRVILHQLKRGCQVVIL